MCANGKNNCLSNLLKLQMKVTHKEPSDIDIDVIMIPKHSDRHTVCVQQDKKGGKMSTDWHGHNKACQTSKVAAEESHNVRGDIDIDR